MEKLLDKVMVDLVANYGFLAIIGVLFVLDHFNRAKFEKNQSIRLAEMNDKYIGQIERILDSRQREQDALLGDIERIIDTIKESLSSHNVKSMQGLSELRTDLDRILDYRVEVKEFLDKQIDKLGCYYSEYNQSLSMLKIQILRLREIIVATGSHMPVLEQLIDDGIITRSQANDAITKVAEKNIKSEE